MIERRKLKKSASVWVSRLWADFARDENLLKFVAPVAQVHKFELLGAETVKINKHLATEQNLAKLRDLFSSGRSEAILNKLVLVEVMFTTEKARLLASALASPACSITELEFKSCRAKSDQMSAIFTALTSNINL